MLTNTNTMRYIVLITTVATTLFGFLSRYLLLGSKAVAEVNYQYSSLFTPAKYSFYIWLLIYLCNLIYSIVQLLPSRKYMKFYDELVIPMVAFNLLTIARITSHVTGQVGFSSFIILGMLITALIAFTIAKKGFVNEGEKRMVLIPFALLSGWLSVATIANISVWLKSMEWNVGGITEPTWTIIMIVAVAIFGLFFAYREGSLVFPMAVAWGIFALYVRHTPNYPTVCTSAIVASVIVAILGVVFYIYRMPKQVNVRKEVLVAEA